MDDSWHKEREQAYLPKMNYVFKWAIKKYILFVTQVNSVHYVFKTYVAKSVLIICKCANKYMD